MFDFFPSVSCALRDLINSGHATVEEVIMDESCKRGFNSDDSALVSFLSTHAEEVLHTAIFSKNNRLASRALSLFSKVNDSLIVQVIEDGLLKQIAPSVFGADDNEDAINRFATITQLVCLQEASNTLENCPFIYNFLPFCGKRLVLGMFEEFLNDEESGFRVIISLMDLPSRIRAAIASEHVVSPESGEINEKKFEEEDILRIIGYFRLIKMLHRSEILQNSVEDKEILRTISEPFNVNDINLLDTQWEAISTITTIDNVEVLENELENHILPLVNFSDDEKYFHQYQAWALHVILVLAQKSEQICKKLEDYDFRSTLKNIVKHFPHHTLAHNAVTEFILGIVDRHDFEKYLLDDIVPFCEELLNNDKTPIEMRAFSWDLIAKIKSSIEEKDIEEVFENIFKSFDEKAMEKVSDIVITLKMEYGGKLPEQTDYSNEEDGLGNLSPEQILLMQKFFSSGRL